MQSSLGTSPPVGVCGAWAQVMLEMLENLQVAAALVETLMHALENLQVAAALVVTRKA